MIMSLICLQTKTQTASVWVNIGEAFENVRRKGLLLKPLRNMITSKMFCHAEQEFQTGKQKVSFQGKLNKSTYFNQGIPPGRILSILFPIFMKHTNTHSIYSILQSITKIACLTDNMIYEEKFSQ